MDDFVPPGLDVEALRAAVDAERVARGMSWVDLARQVQIPTIRNMGVGGRIQADVVVLLLQWLGMQCDEFVVRPGGGAAPWAARHHLPKPPPLFARFDSIALHESLSRVREARQLTWQQVATELGTTTSVIARLKKGGRVDAQLMVAAAEWAQTPVESMLQPSQALLGPARMDAGGSLRGT